MSRRLPAVAVAMLVATPAFAQQAVTPSSSTSQAPVPQATATQPINMGNTNFLSRFFQAYMDGFNAPPATNQAPAPRRGLPQPIDSPPFPFGDYQYGGSSIIGVSTPNPMSTPLMTALYGGPGGQAL